MQLEDAYPVIVADRLAACRDLYVGQLGFEIVFEATWFAYLKAGDRGPGIAFMAADHLATSRPRRRSAGRACS